ncbi:hypothetical protein Hypma_014853 [Hypsizygus marmoreus]|uniref:Uncharacterized protein n=1 Tax=Hypsizygus marmoreus TaxID=39966 RepID=A0A369K6F4_HYPMA|nr:hypothetical protein Hypma_014853 [Hypsizygus marmoreus]
MLQLAVFLTIFHSVRYLCQDSVFQTPSRVPVLVTLVLFSCVGTTSRYLRISDSNFSDGADVLRFFSSNNATFSNVFPELPRLSGENSKQYLPTEGHDRNPEAGPEQREWKPGHVWTLHRY